MPLDRREERLGEISTPAQFKEYQENLKSFFVSRIGGFPERTPLQAKVVGKIEGGDHRVEKVIYESQPQHHVTATLYLPKTKPPYPAVLIACGHSKTGKGADYNQFTGITLARNGIAAFCYDPIGQGERSQILPAEGRKLSSVAEHFPDRFRLGFAGNKHGAIPDLGRHAGHRLLDESQGHRWIQDRLYRLLPAAAP